MLQRTVSREPNIVINFDAFYINRELSRLLVRTTVVETSTQSFYVVIETKGDELVLRIDPRTSVERTNGVKKAVALVTKNVMSATGLKIARTNIREFLQDSNERKGGE